MVKITVVIAMVAMFCLAGAAHATETDQAPSRSVQDVLSQSGFAFDIVDETSSSDTFNNAQVWDELYQYLVENGTDIDGMKGIRKIGEDYTTYIALVEGDTDTIYIVSKTDMDLVSNSLTFALKKNDPNVEFRFDDSMNSDGYDFDIYVNGKAYGHVDISTITSQTLLEAESFEQESKDINGNLSTTTDASHYFPDGSPRQTLYMLLTDLPDVLSSTGLDLTMNDLGFFANLDKVYGIDLADGETILNLVNDVYTVVPDDWTLVENGNVTMIYPPENAEQINNHAIIISTTQFTNSGGLGAISKGEQRETLLDASLSSFRKEGFTMTDEQTGIEVRGFQARKAQVVWSESIGYSDLSLISFLVDGYRLNDYNVMLGYKIQRGIEPNHLDVYQRMVDTIYVDTDGSYTARLTGGNSSI